MKLRQVYGKEEGQVNTFGKKPDKDEMPSGCRRGAMMEKKETQEMNRVYIRWSRQFRAGRLLFGWILAVWASLAGPKGAKPWNQKVQAGGTKRCNLQRDQPFPTIPELITSSSGRSRGRPQLRMPIPEIWSRVCHAARFSLLRVRG